MGNSVPARCLSTRACAVCAASVAGVGALFLVRFRSCSVFRTLDWTWVESAVSGSTAEVHGGELALARTGLIVINAPQPADLLRRMWAHAGVHICADGGADRLREVDGALVPKFVVGDLDSASLNVREDFRARGAEIRDLSGDEDTTDLEKSLVVAREQGCSRIIVTGQYAGFGGRVDHLFGIANALQLFSDLQIVAVGADCFMFLLAPGEHDIRVPNASEAPHCGLVPLGSPCRKISTTGLRWNMKESEMKFGGLISVCNQVDPASKGLVHVKTSCFVLWTCTLPLS